jgi:hypothetical protein
VVVFRELCRSYRSMLDIYLVSAVDGGSFVACWQLKSKIYTTFMSVYMMILNCVQ